MIPFERIPTFDTSKDVVLYVPCSFNHHAIDGIILRLEKGEKKDKALLFPLKITIAKSHENSKESFFNQWDEWKGDLQDFDIEVTFLWITTKDLKQKRVVNNPTYMSRNIHLEDVDRDIWKRYEAALRR
jgi:hypothetical protein